MLFTFSCNPQAPKTELFKRTLLEKDIDSERKLM